MKKIFFVLLAIAVLYSSRAAAQLKLGINGTLAHPVGDFGDVSGPGFGGGLTLKSYSENKHWLVGIDLSYIAFSDRSGINISNVSYEQSTKYNIIPLKVAVDYFLLVNKIKPFIGLDAGVYFSKYSSSINAPYYAYLNSSDSWQAFGIAPGGGLSFELSSKTDLNLQVRYNVMFDKDKIEDSNGKFLTFNLGLAFALN